MAKLTRTQITKLPIGKTVAAEGLIARRHDANTVTYLFRYRDHTTGKKKAVALTPVGIDGLNDAIELAAQVRAKVGQHRIGVGKDPAAERKEQQARVALTVNELLDQYIADKQGEKRALDNQISAFKCHVRPKFGAVSAYELDADAVAAHLTVLKKRIPETTKHVRKFLNLAFKWARGAGYSKLAFELPEMEMPEAARRDRVLNNIEIADVWHAAGEMCPAYGALVRLLLLTGCRREEMGGLRAEEVKRDRITIPAARMKAGRDHDVPLLPQVAEQAALVLAGDVVAYSYYKARLDAAIAARREAAGRPAMPAWVLHDLRRTVRTRLGELRIDRDTAEAILAHTRPQIEDIYNRHDAFADKQAALIRWHRYLNEIVAGGTAGDNVTELRPAAVAVAG